MIHIYTNNVLHCMNIAARFCHMGRPGRAKGIVGHMGDVLRNLSKVISLER